MFHERKVLLNFGTHLISVPTFSVAPKQHTSPCAYHHQRPHLPRQQTMGAAHAKLAAGMMQGAYIPGALDVEDQRTPQCFSVLSSRLSHSRTANESKPCSQPNDVLRARDNAAAQDDVRRKEWRTDAALLLDLFESAKLAGAVKDTSNQGPTEWMGVSSGGLSPRPSRTTSCASCGDNGAEKFEQGNSVVSDAATEDSDNTSDVLGLASLGLLMDGSACLAKDILPGASEVEDTVSEGTWA